jgi:DNA repair protein RadA/Sms
LASKLKTVFVCNECGSDYRKWQGQCTDCNAWNTLSEVKVNATSHGISRHQHGFSGASSGSINVLKDVELDEVPRVKSGNSELDLVLGGGFVPGSCVLLGGEPGAGKSTILLQTLCHMAQNETALYVTGEESSQQVAMRARRLDLPLDKLQIMTETSVENICLVAKEKTPRLLVVDSIQVVHLEDITSAPGSVSQVRESAAALVRYAKQTNTILIIVGHVTKDGTLAGPKVLEHMIDCSLMLEGRKDSQYRTLRGIKNRFGAVNELGVFAMTERGLKGVPNPSAIFLQRNEEVSSGSIVVVIWEGTRPMLVELQALVDDSHLGSPRRVSLGLDHNRLSMLIAVLHRHGNIMVGDQDVFVNVVGGVKIIDTSADLALILSIISSFRNKPIPRNIVVFGEVGLSGEIRPVSSGQARLKEAVKHGFTRAIVPIANAPKKPITGLKVIGVKKIFEALQALF